MIAILFLQRRFYAKSNIILNIYISNYVVHMLCNLQFQTIIANFID